MALQLGMALTHCNNTSYKYHKQFIENCPEPTYSTSHSSCMIPNATFFRSLLGFLQMCVPQAILQNIFNKSINTLPTYCRL
jgi:hypothetical protein